MSHAVVFVGGPRDGTLLTVEELRPYLHVDAWREGTIEIVQYRLLPIAGEKRRFHVYALAGMTTDDVFDRLLRCYVEREHDSKGR